MRAAFTSALLARAERPDFVFLTGDLGFKALEPLRDAMGRRFINAGVAEQNMVSVAAGLAKGGLRPWAYSIAPFIYARPFEQVRNDVALHGLPVILVGNGGGYGYGVMGGTHHALEDYGVLLCLPGVRVFAPAFDRDLEPTVERLFSRTGPGYLRLGLSEEPRDFELPAYAAWRHLLAGGGPTLVAVGPLAGGLIHETRDLDPATRPDLWALTELPADPLPPEFLTSLDRSQHLVVVEEHVAHGGAGALLAHDLLTQGLAPRRFTHHAARGYVSGRYGSQTFHRRESGLDAASVVAALAPPNVG